MRTGDSFKRDTLCPEGQSYTTYEMGADGTNYKVELTNIGNGFVQVQDITPLTGGTIVYGGGNPPSMGV